MILPDRFYMVTRRCSQRMFLLRPDPQSNLRFLYCLIEAANRWGITVVLPSMMSNHHHSIIYDRQGHVVEFMQHFHSMLARSMNALRGRWENFFSTEEPSLVELVDRNDILDTLRARQELGNTDYSRSGRPDVSAGLAATCAIRSGRVVCWGANAHGEVGLSADMIDALPTEIPVPANQCATAISITWRHACAITVDDANPADGCTPNGATHLYNSAGQLGNAASPGGTPDLVVDPMGVDMILPLVAVSARSSLH
jgi:alpha-tubulin suppressor-like RCC1 family protein